VRARAIDEALQYNTAGDGRAARKKHLPGRN
jgi:hypothetical protein